MHKDLWWLICYPWRYILPLFFAMLSVVAFDLVELSMAALRLIAYMVLLEWWRWPVRILKNLCSHFTIYPIHLFFILAYLCLVSAYHTGSAVQFMKASSTLVQRFLNCCHFQPFLKGETEPSPI